MNLFISLFFIAIGFFFLVKGADWFVDNASGIASKLGVSSLVIGLTIVAFGTSMPELAVSVTAALEGSNEIAVGNVVGSNIFNLLVVAGMSACIYPLVINPTILKRDWPISTFAALLLGVFLLDLNLSRIEAFILLIFFGLTLFIQLKEAKSPEEQQKTEERPMSRLILFLLIGIVCIIVGGQFAVEGATQLARILGLSETLIGLTIVAIGTSLPELVTSIVAAKKGENEIAMGNVIGSNVFNLLCILGISAFLRPIHIASTAIIDCLILCIVSFVFWFLSKKHPLDKKIGSIMVITYILYTIYIIVR